MKVYDLAHQLAAELRRSPEHDGVRAAGRAVAGNDAAARMLRELRQREEDLRSKLLAGEQPSEEAVEQLNQLSELARMNSHIAVLFQAESRFLTLLQDVQRIIIQGCGLQVEPPAPNVKGRSDVRSEDRPGTEGT